MKFTMVVERPTQKMREYILDAMSMGPEEFPSLKSGKLLEDEIDLHFDDSFIQFVMSKIDTIAVPWIHVVRGWPEGV